MTLTARAYAKTNLCLEVLGKRDDGYHELDTVMHSVSIFDEITLNKKDRGITVECDNNEICGEDNIVYSAAKAFFTHSNIEFGAHFNIKKGIPVAAGMGGGSADAAAALLLLNKASGEPLDDDVLFSIAKTLGADVPFCLMGGTARAKGIGEKLQKLPRISYNFVFIKQFEKQSTAQMYALLDSSENIICGATQSLVDAISSGNKNLALRYFANSFERCWDMQKLTEAFSNFNVCKTFLSGSGPTVGAVFESETDAIYCAKALTDSGIPAFFAKSVPFGVEIV